MRGREGLSGVGVWLKQLWERWRFKGESGRDAVAGKLDRPSHWGDGESADQGEQIPLSYTVDGGVGRYLLAGSCAGHISL